MEKTKWTKYLFIITILILLFDLLLISLNTFYVDSLFRPVYNVFFYHVSSAWLAYVTFTMSLICSVMYLKTKNKKWSWYGKNSVIIGVLFTAGALIIGALWFNATSGRYQNVYWNWDPRQTMTLVLLFSYISYLIFASMIDDPTQKAKLTSILGIVLFPTVPLSYYAAKIFVTLHPLIEPTPSDPYWDPFKIFTLIFTVFAVTLFFIYVLKKLVEIDEQKAELGELYQKKMEED